MEECSVVDAFDYVGKIFPDIEVRLIDVRQATPLLLKKIGYDGIGGFFENISKTVVIAAHQLVSVNLDNFSVKAKLHKDEVIVHELLHYCHYTLGYNSSVNLKEEFAYGWSYGYLKNKGYTDKEIIQDNYLPYLYNVCYKDGFFEALTKNGISMQKIKNASLIMKDRIINPLKSSIHKEVLNMAMLKGAEIIKIYKKKIDDGDVYKNFNNKKLTIFDNLDLD